MKIMVVDDSMAARIMITGFIKKIGEYEILEAADGQEAIDLFKKNQPDFTFLDLTMPVMDGFEALKQIKENNHDAIVAVLSADIQTKTVEKVKDLGANIFIKKPVTEAKIVSALKQFISDSADK